MTASMGYPPWLPILLGFLTAVGPITTDMYLPAFPAVEASLHAPTGSVQITLATWFAGLAIGQLTQGSLSDRYGRRGPLIVGTAVYTLANAGCALAPDLTTLAAMRFIAGFGGSASMVIPRAVVRDLADGHAAAQLMAKLILVMGAAPILAPTLGGLVLTVASWHAIFWISTGYGALCCVLVALLLPDTLAGHRRLRLSFVGAIQRYMAVARDRVFLAYAAMGGFGMFGMFAYIGGSSPVFIETLHFSPAQYGILFDIGAASFIAGSQISPRLLPRFGAHRVVRVASIVYLLAALVLTVLAVLDVGGAWGIVPPVMVAMGCMGFVMPNSAVGALSRHAAQAGSASALMGTLQFCLAACSGALVGLLTDGTARPMAGLMLFGAVCVVIADRLRPAAAGTKPAGTKPAGTKPAGTKKVPQLSSTAND
jgi:DHA1 family bicyclomycin/chloramphenicol resistance-like MFS transporter